VGDERAFGQEKAMRRPFTFEDGKRAVRVLREVPDSLARAGDDPKRVAVNGEANRPYLRFSTG
jgi:hypothetical protein